MKPDLSRASSWRRFYYRHGRSDKYWCIRLKSTSYEVWFGRSGTVGQQRTKHFDTVTEAARAFAQIIDQKLNKGYVEVEESAQFPRAEVQVTRDTVARVVVKHDEARRPRREIVFE